MVAVLLLVAAAAVGGAAAAATSCKREVVEGNLDGDAHFVARDVIIYAERMFPGNPVVVRLEGRADTSGWYSVHLPGVRAFDQLRVVGDGPRVTSYFLEEGALHFSADVDKAGVPGPVQIYYIAGSASWSHHYELDVERSEVALIGKVNWNSRAMFRDVDMLLVSGKLHSVPSNSWQSNQEAPPAAMSGSSIFDFSSRVSSANTDNLAVFSVPSSSDEGIFVVHSAAGIDMPGSNGHGLRSCAPSAFYLRVNTSPVALEEIVLVREPFVNGTAPDLVVEVKNRGELPWMPGRADIYRSGILAGQDDIPYTARNGSVRMEMGTALDVRVTTTVERSGGRFFHNYTIENLDVSPYTVQVEVPWQAQVGGHPAFVRDGGVLKARGVLAPGQFVTVGWWAYA